MRPALPPEISGVERQQRAFVVTWSNGSVDEYPFIWLRDNDPHELHPDTQERTFDLTSVPIDILPDSYALLADDALAGTRLQVRWPGKQDESTYSAQWLYQHRPGQQRSDPAQVQRESWAAGAMPTPPRFNACACSESPGVLMDALKTLKKSGIVIIEGLADEPTAGEKFGELIGFKRQSNYGVIFEVKSKPQPNNLAYTSLALPLHTDLSNQESVPGFQFLHCYRNNACGGRSVFADGMAVVEDFKRECRAFYTLLSEVEVPWRFFDTECDVRQHRPVIGLKPDGAFQSLTFNAHLADIPDFSADLLYDFYAAFQELMLRIRSSKYDIEYPLASGEMVVFDNRRILHGRTAFDPDSGDRHLRGYYIENNEIDSHIRMLAALHQQENAV